MTIDHPAYCSHLLKLANELSVAVDIRSISERQVAVALEENTGTLEVVGSLLAEARAEVHNLIGQVRAELDWLATHRPL